MHPTTFDVTIDDETIHTNDDHPFLVVLEDSLQWTEAKHLSIGDKVLASDDSTGTVEAVTVIDEPQTMYNLTVDLVATYVVGEGQWVVHNVDLSGIGRWVPRLIRLAPPNLRKKFLNNYARNLVVQAAEIQGLENVIRNTIIQFSDEVGNANANAGRINIGLGTLKGSTQQQLQIASHELWHSQRIQTGTPLYPSNTVGYALEEAIVETRARFGMRNFFGNRYSTGVQRTSFNYTAAWQREAERLQNIVSNSNTPPSYLC